MRSMNKSSTTAEDIIACARCLIADGGYNGFSYADIAAVVGINQASIHRFFPSKIDLVKALLARYSRETAASIRRLERGLPDACAQLGAYVQHWKRCIEDASVPFCLCAVLGGELAMLPDEIANAVRAHFRFLSGWLASVLERGARQGEIELVHPCSIEAQAFMATVHGAMLSARAYGDASMFSSIMDPQVARLSVPKICFPVAPFGKSAGRMIEPQF